MRFLKLATVAGLVGLAVFNADAIGRILGFAQQSFSGAVGLAPGTKRAGT